MPIITIMCSETQNGLYLAGWPMSAAQTDEALDNLGWEDLEWADFNHQQEG